MKLEQRMERSERLLETNEENKREVERSQRQLRQARSQVAGSAAQVQSCRAQLQQAIAARNAAQQRAANDENGGSVPASYDAAVDSASAALSEANRELQEAQREEIRATDELSRAEAEQRASAEQLQSVVGELQAVSEKYGVEMQKTAQLMSMPKGHLASPIMQQMGVGQAKVNDLCRRIAASLGITIAVSEGVSGTTGGLSSRLRGLSGGGAFGGTLPANQGSSQAQGFFSRLFGGKKNAGQSGRTFSGYEVDSHGFVHGANHEAFLRDWEGYNSDNFDTKMFDGEGVVESISAGSVEGINVSEYDVENPETFWSQHERNGTKESFVQIASHIPEVRSALEFGRSLSDLLEDERLGTCASLYFDPAKMTQVMDCGGYYEFQSNGRHRILAARELGYDIPVRVIGSRRRKS